MWRVLIFYYDGYLVIVGTMWLLGQLDIATTSAGNKSAYKLKWTLEKKVTEFLYL